MKDNNVFIQRKIIRSVLGYCTEAKWPPKLAGFNSWAKFLILNNHFNNYEVQKDVDTSTVFTWQAIMCLFRPPWYMPPPWYMAPWQMTATIIVPPEYTFPPSSQQLSHMFVICLSYVCHMFAICLSYFRHIYRKYFLHFLSKIFYQKYFFPLIFILESYVRHLFVISSYT